MQKTLLISVLFIVLHLTSMGQTKEINGIIRGTGHYSVDSYFIKRNQVFDANKQRNFKLSAPLAKELALAYPFDPELFYLSGLANYNNGNYQSAISDFLKADSLGVPSHERWLPYWVSTAYGKLQKKEGALLWLNKALSDYRYQPPEDLYTDSSFLFLKNEKEFLALFPTPLDKKNIERTKGWNTDIDFLMHVIKDYNVKYSNEPLPDLILSSVKSLRQELSKLTDAEIYIRLQQIVVMLHQGHSSLLGMPQSMQMPVTFYFFDDGLYIINADADYKKYIGSKVTFFSKTPVTKAFELIKTVIAGDNIMTTYWWGPYYLNKVDLLKGLGIIPNTENVEITLENKDGEISKVNLSPRPAERPGKLFASVVNQNIPPPLYLQNVYKNFWFTNFPGKDLIYFQFNQVVNLQDTTLTQFGLYFRKTLNDNKTRNLIIDLRHNNGGDTYIYRELLRTLIEFDTKEGNKLYVITGRNTYSAAENFCVDLNRLTNAIFVGEPTGGRPLAAGDPLEFVLPYSGIRFGISAKSWALSSPSDRRNWITPQIPIPLTANDYFDNIDPVMKYLFQIIK